MSASEWAEKNGWDAEKLGATHLCLKCGAIGEFIGMSNGNGESIEQCPVDGTTWVPAERRREMGIVAPGEAV